MKKIKFTLKGTFYELSDEEVEKKMQPVEPENITTHYVIVNKKKYPPKQVISEVLGLPRIRFTSQDAYNILRRLGFEQGEQ